MSLTGHILSVKLFKESDSHVTPLSLDMEKMLIETSISTDALTAVTW
jgi:hypothetical protein